MTGACQPLDVGVFKPFKLRVRSLFRSYLYENPNKSPNMQKLIDTVIQAWDDLSPEIIKRSFRESGVYDDGLYPVLVPQPPSISTNQNVHDIYDRTNNRITQEITESDDELESDNDLGDNESEDSGEDTEIDEVPNSAPKNAFEIMMNNRNNIK